MNIPKNKMHPSIASGALCNKNKTIFRLYHPTAEAVELRIYGKDGALAFTMPMIKKTNGFFVLEKYGVEGCEYEYAVTRNGKTVLCADPYLIHLSENGRGIITDMSASAPEGWELDNFVKCSDPRNAVIYELSVRDFSSDPNAGFKHKGKFLAFTEKNVTNSRGNTIGLEYIKTLGVTHIQLLPVFDFDLDGREYNWGYNPRFFNAPSGYYSEENGILEFRSLITAAHRLGIGVIMDVVYNHSFSEDIFENMYPGEFFRVDDKGALSNGSGCGNETASEHNIVRRFIVESLCFWAREFHIDGFRFDLMGVLDIETLHTAQKKLRRINPDILLYGEGWTGGASSLDEKHRAVMHNAYRLPGFAFFNDSFRDAVKGSVFSTTDMGYVSGAPDISHIAPVAETVTGIFNRKFWTHSPRQSINYVECHDNLTLFDKLSATINGADIDRIKSADKMAAALVIFSNGIPFIAAGQEFLRSKKGCANSYNTGDEINMLSWDMITENRDIVEYYRGLIALRKQFFPYMKFRAFQKSGNGFYIEYDDLSHNNGVFYFAVNPTETAFSIGASGNFEIYADSNACSPTLLCQSTKLVCAKYSILFARRI